MEVGCPLDRVFSLVFVQVVVLSWKKWCRSWCQNRRLKMQVLQSVVRRLSLLPRLLSQLNNRGLELPLCGILCGELVSQSCDSLSCLLYEFKRNANYVHVARLTDDEATKYCQTVETHTRVPSYFYLRPCPELWHYCRRSQESDALD